ncbi:MULTISPECIES: hypothetical protein [Flavobacterium]|nr:MULTISPECIES: hypothetical protein [Flavobacterium]
MGKNKYFSTKSVFGQLISLIDDSMIQKAGVRAEIIPTASAMPLARAQCH